jgi:hypothetical protein
VDPRPLGGLADLADLLEGEGERSRRFLGGLVAGALVGAAVAGAVLLRRRTAGAGRPGETPADASGADPRGHDR